MRKLVAVHWFSAGPSPDPIGIVVVDDTVFNERLAFIGTGRGFNVDDDVNTIIEWGAKLTKREVQQLVVELGLHPTFDPEHP